MMIWIAKCSYTYIVHFVILTKKKNCQWNKILQENFYNFTLLDIKKILTSQINDNLLLKTRTQNCVDRI